MSWSIANVTKGQTPTLLSAGLANEVIDALNMLGNIQIESSDQEGVVYEDGYGIKIHYKGPESTFQFDGSISMLAADPTKLIEITFEGGKITNISTEGSSGYEWKSFDVCEGDSSASYDFLVKS